MKYLFAILLFISASAIGFTQETKNQDKKSQDSTAVKTNTSVKGTVIDLATDTPIDRVNIVNLNQVIGTSTDDDGNFEIKANVNDTLHLSYLGFKSIKVRVTNDWIKFGETKIGMTELALALEADFLHNIFGKKPNELRKLKKMKKDDEIRNLLASRFDREMLMVLLQVDKFDLDEIVNQCNYSKNFIESANDLQILDAISECYEEYKVLNRNKSGRF